MYTSPIYFKVGLYVVKLKELSMYMSKSESALWPGVSMLMACVLTLRGKKSYREYIQFVISVDLIILWRWAFFKWINNFFYFKQTPFFNPEKEKWNVWWIFLHACKYVLWIIELRVLKHNWQNLSAASRSKCFLFSVQGYKSGLVLGYHTYSTGAHTVLEYSLKRPSVWIIFTLLLI